MGWNELAAKAECFEDITLPFLTDELPGIGGAIKIREEDFRVEEMPLYEAAGEGTHVYAQVEKKGFTTSDMINRVAAILGINRRDIGYAGLKDSVAITRQWISIEHVDPDRVRQIEVPNIKVLQVARHNNKLRIGHLAANRFIIRLRRFSLPPQDALRRAREGLDTLVRRGVPNYFGPQRFGTRNDGHLLGRAIISGQIDQFVDIFLGRPCQIESAAVTTARQFYEQGRYQEALMNWPHLFRDHRRALRQMVRKGGNKKSAFSAIDRNFRRLLVSAYQSHIFNMVLAARMPGVDKLLKGDMAYKHDNRACFRVEDAHVEQSRCEAFDVSPTGPLFGPRMTVLTDEAGAIENPILDPVRQLTGDFKTMERDNARGGRRPMRFQPKNVDLSCGQDDLGDYIEFHFDLPSGCYATILLREITKNHVV